MPDKKKLFLLVEECSSANRKSFFIGMKVMFNSVELMFSSAELIFNTIELKFSTAEHRLPQFGITNSI